jgi:hypothetical protein
MNNSNMQQEQIRLLTKLLAEQKHPVTAACAI